MGGREDPSRGLGMISPVHLDGDAVDLAELQRPPGSVGDEASCVDETHPAVLADATLYDNGKGAEISHIGIVSLSDVVTVNPPIPAEWEGVGRPA